MDRFQVHRVTAGNTDELAEIIQSFVVTSGMKSSMPRYLPLVNTVQHIAALGAQTVLVQIDVHDPDFLAEHNAYYSKWSYEVPRFCVRLHFFALEPASDNPLEVIDQMAEEPDSYLGFVTLRPIRLSPQAASILHPVIEGNQHFILSKDDFEVNIAGQQFKVAGTPFMQQDNAVGACAQASIWMGLRTLRRKEGQIAYSPAQITTAATRFLVKGRTLPNRGGLVVEQITEAIRAAGYAPHIIPLRDRSQPANEQILQHVRSSIYPYVESGIPVLLVLFPENREGHAVLLIGHGWDSNPVDLIGTCQIKVKSDGELLDVYDASSWVSPFFIHNDNTGPYLPLPNDAPPDQYSLSDAVSAIPFLQSNIFVDAAEAKLTCHHLLALSLGGDEEEGAEDEANIKLPDLVTRVYLHDKADFRASVLASDMPDDVKTYYREKWLPKRIWIMEINHLQDYANSPGGNSIRIGEILLDPSSEAEDGHFLSIHLGADLFPNKKDGNGIMIDRDAFNGEITAYKVSGNRYSPLVRS